MGPRLKPINVLVEIQFSSVPTLESHEYIKHRIPIEKGAGRENSKTSTGYIDQAGIEKAKKLKNEYPKAHEK